MSFALCIMAGFLAANFTHGKALDLSEAPYAASFLGAALCLVGAGVLKINGF